MARKKTVFTESRSVRLNVDLDKYVKTLAHGEFGVLVNDAIRKYLKDTGVRLEDYKD